ncbi:MAG: restriction endonuclease subunit S, partial [Hydrogenophilales bacterium CG15_BIG_FIL_POST_REV_8_21_14_020_62_31]
PACGTAGFLISAYKYILANNRINMDEQDGQDKNKASCKSCSSMSISSLTPDEKGRLAKNFKGYDISPDMVRLSLVNLYLHGFTDPHIFEYDTLTSEERWNEFADVILANPPFMSPKGGIKPHKRFSIQAKRSEVLFVDYMAEHLTPTGRAAIIVPEGIIFQSQTAYKALRKMLVENALVAVVSLPAGCFNPYSGVKTSVLILDKTLAKAADTIAFFKVENDGFGLGAQRRAIDKNDLPQVLAGLKEFIHMDRQDGQDKSRSSCKSCSSMLNALVERGLAQIVPKEKLAANGDYSLSGERYREGDARRSVFPLRRFEEVCTLEYGASLPKEKRVEGPYPVVGSNGITGYHNEYLVEGPAIVVGRKGSAGEVTLIEKNCFPIDTTYYVKQTNPTESNISFLYWLLKTLNLPELRGGAGIPGLNRTDVYETHQIPLPPLEVQKEIVAEIEGYQKVINGARAVLDHYRPHIPIHPDWPMVLLGDVFKLSSGRGLTQTNMKEGRYPVYGGNGRTGTHSEYFLETANIVIGRVGAYCGAVHITEPKAWVTDNGLYVTKFKQQINLGYLAQVLIQLKLNQFAKVGGQPSISQTTVYEGAIPLPPLATQQAIVAEIEAEQALVAANRELITRFEKKIQATLARIWGES